MFYLCWVKEIDDFKKWLDDHKRSMQSLTDKIESQTPMSAKDSIFLEQLHKLYENGYLDA